MNVLIAEVDTALRLMLTTLLTEWGYTVTSAKDGDAAWEILCATEHPHLVILDWMMPGIEGPEIVRRLREREPDKLYYAIIMTSRDGIGSAALDSGADDFVGKPFDRDELQARVAVGKRVSRYQSQLQEFNSRIRGKNAVQERFLDMISHEYRTPLAILQANIDIMALKEQQAGRMSSMSLVKMQHAIYRLVDLFEATHRRKGLEYQPLNLVFEITDAELCVRQAVAAATRYWGERFTCHFTLPTGLQVNIDRSRMQTAILNLLDNAAKYTSPDLPVILRIGVLGERLELAICNQSLAPLSNDTEVLFQNFRRGTNSSGTSGTGQGLFMARSIVEQHGGSLDLLLLHECSNVVTMMRLPLSAVPEENDV